MWAVRCHRGRVAELVLEVFGGGRRLLFRLGSVGAFRRFIRFISSSVRAVVGAGCEIFNSGPSFLLLGNVVGLTVRGVLRAVGCRCLCSRLLFRRGTSFAIRM